MPCAAGAADAAASRRRPTDRVSVAHRTLPDEVDDLPRRAARGAPVTCRTPTQHLERLARHYRPGAGWGEAFAGVLAELFADEGLVLRRSARSGAGAPPPRRSTAARSPTPARSPRRSRSASAPRRGGFAAHGARPTRRAAVVLPSGRARRAALPARPRDRAASPRSAATGVHDAPTLLAALDADPLCFSTSALLRPILQDTLLPTAAYVGGPAEVAYFAQLAPLYAAFDLAMPLVVPRAAFRDRRGPGRRLLARLGLTPDDAARADDELLAALAPRARALADVVRTLVRLVRRRARRRSARASRPPAPACRRALEKTRATVRMAALTAHRSRREDARAPRRSALVDDVRRLKCCSTPTACRRSASTACRTSPRATASAPSSSACSPPSALRARARGTSGRERPLASASSAIPSLGGSGVVASELAVGLAQRGHRVHVIASAPPSRAAARLRAPVLPRGGGRRATRSSSTRRTSSALAATIVEVATRARARPRARALRRAARGERATSPARCSATRAPRVVTTLHGTDVTRVGGDPSYRVDHALRGRRAPTASPCPPTSSGARRERLLGLRRAADRGHPELRRHRSLRAAGAARPARASTRCSPLPATRRRRARPLPRLELPRR